MKYQQLKLTDICNILDFLLEQIFTEKRSNQTNL